MSLVSVVVPVYNEEELIEWSHGRLKETMDSAGVDYELIFVNDGSRDRSPELLHSICESDPRSKMLSFSRNFGHQCAISAGMRESKGDAVVVIDADLQDPPEVILAMIEKWREGYDVVYGKRGKRKGETAFKLLTAKIFYRVLDSLTTVDIPVDTGDFRLLSRRVCDVMNSLPEHNRYIRGLVSWVGFKQCAVEYIREERTAGETKYTLKKMIRLATDGIVSFSYKPLMFAAGLGIFTAAASAVYLVVALILDLCGVWAINGLYYIGGFILLALGFLMIALGIVGRYIGQMCDEVRGRPYYIIAEKVGFDD